MTPTYVPINCEFHDVLEATATRARRAAIVYVDASGEQATAHARILDLRSKDASEYMHLDDGQVIRLDAIVSVDGIARDAFPPSA